MTQTKKPNLPKPPKGLIPEKLHNEARFRDIERAIERYKAVGFEIPRAWINEYFELKEKICL